ncbi:hypothetical protein DXG01_002836, partial [Tephrocybe rancida]
MLSPTTFSLKSVSGLQTIKDILACYNPISLKLQPSDLQLTMVDGWELYELKEEVAKALLTIIARLKEDIIKESQLCSFSVVLVSNYIYTQAVNSNCLDDPSKANSDQIPGPILRKYHISPPPALAADYDHLAEALLHPSLMNEILDAYRALQNIGLRTVTWMLRFKSDLHRLELAGTSRRVDGRLECVEEDIKQVKFEVERGELFYPPSIETTSDEGQCREDHSGHHSLTNWQLFLGERNECRDVILHKLTTRAFGTGLARSPVPPALG